MSITKYLIQRIETIDNVLDQPSIKNNMYLKNLCIDVIKQWELEREICMKKIQYSTSYETYHSLMREG